MLPVNITDEHCTKFICVVDVAETEIHSTSLDICQYRRIPGGLLVTHLARNVVVRDLLNLTVAAGGNLVKLVHRDFQVNTHGADNTSSTNGAAQGQLRADDVDLLADLDEDIALAKTDTVRVLFVERLAGFMVAEVDISISGRINVDLLDSTAVNQRQHLGGGSPARRQSGEDDASHLRSCKCQCHYSNQALRLECLTRLVSRSRGTPRFESNQILAILVFDSGDTRMSTSCRTVFI